MASQVPSLFLTLKNSMTCGYSSTCRWQPRTFRALEWFLPLPFCSMFPWLEHLANYSVGPLLTVALSVHQKAEPLKNA